VHADNYICYRLGCVNILVPLEHTVVLLQILNPSGFVMHPNLACLVCSFKLDFLLPGTNVNLDEMECRTQ